MRKPVNVGGWRKLMLIAMRLCGRQNVIWHDLRRADRRAMCALMAAAGVVR